MRTIVAMCISALVACTLFIFNALRWPNEYGAFVGAPQTEVAVLVEKPTEFLDKIYPTLTAQAKRVIVKPGDRITLKGLEWRFITSAGQPIQSALPGAGQRNTYCATFKPQEPDPTENAQSVGSHIMFGKFRVVHPGDLTWNKEAELMCPNNRLGTADLLIVGDGGHRATLERLGAGSERVKFVGRLPSHDLGRYYAHALAVVTAPRRLHDGHAAVRPQEVAEFAR